MNSQKLRAQTIASGATIIMAASFASRILGYLREKSIAYLYGNSPATDAFWAAFNGPDLLYTVVAGGALSAAFLPLFLETREKEGEAAGWRLVGDLAGTLGAIVAVLALGIVVFAPWVVRLLVTWAPGTHEFELCVFFTRLVAVQPVLLALSALATSVHHSFRQFTIPAVAWLVYNLGIIAGIWLGSQAGAGDRGLAGASLGVVIGALLMVLVQLPALLRAGMRWRIRFALLAPKVKVYFARFLPVMVGTALSYLVLFWLPGVFGSRYEGGVTTLRYATRLVVLPFSLFAVSIAVATFPTLAAEALKARGHDFAGVFSRSTRAIALLTIPSAVGLAILAVPINILLWQGGKFGTGAALASAFAVVWYMPALVVLSVSQLIGRGFYALKDVWTPATVAGVYLAATAVMTALLVHTPMRYGALAAATSAGGLLTLALAIMLLRRRAGLLGGRAIWATALRSLVASAVMGAVVFFLARALSERFGVPMTQFGITAPDPRAVLPDVSAVAAGKVVVSCIAAGGAVYAGVLWLLGAEEVKLLWGAVRRRRMKNE